MRKARPQVRCWLPASHCRCLASSKNSSVTWDLCRIKWCGGMFYSEHFAFPSKLQFHEYSTLIYHQSLVQAQPSLCNSQVPEGPVQVKFSASQNWVYSQPYVHIHILYSADVHTDYIHIIVNTKNNIQYEKYLYIHNITKIMYLNPIFCKTV
jgi:hypothetical protein